MNYLYSQSKDSFYPKDLLSSYTTSKTLPADVVEVTDEDFLNFSLKRKDNHKRVYEGGVFSWKKFTADPERAVSEEMYWVGLELTRVREELEKVQDSDPSGIGTVAQWRDYRKLLRVWSSNENFPNAEFRPKAPDA